MLTKSEKEWLENRKPGDWCVTHDCSAMFEGECISVTCYMDISWLYRDAAEFSERVAATLAADENSGIDEDCPPNMPYGWGRLKAARLKVEEEMDAD